MAEQASEIAPDVKSEESAPASTAAPSAETAEEPKGELSSEEKAQIIKANLDEADELFESAQKNIKENNLEAAVEAMGKCLEIRVSHFGEATPETATAYYKYGCVLLYKAVEDTGVFGTNMPESVTGEGEESDGDGDDKDDEAEGSKEDGEEEGEEEEDTGGDMGLAWDMLETARIIWSNHPTGKSKELANVHEKLGDIHMEQEVFDRAVEEYSKSLKYLGDCESSEERAMLGVLFQYSLALQMQSMFEEAESKCKEAVEVAKVALAARKTLGTPEGAKEAAELEEVLEDLNIKLEELTDLANQERSAKATLQEAMAGVMGPLKGAMKGSTAGSSSGASSSSAGASTSSAFDAPKLSSSSSGAAAAPVMNIGVVGRGRNRVTLAPTSTSSAVEPTASGSGAPKENEPPKRARNLEDMMGGGDGATTTVGFGSATPAVSVEPKKAKVSFAECAVETN